MNERCVFGRETIAGENVSFSFLSVCHGAAIDWTGNQRHLWAAGATTTGSKFNSFRFLSGAVWMRPLCFPSTEKIASFSPNLFSRQSCVSDGVTCFRLGNHLTNFPVKFLCSKLSAIVGAFLRIWRLLAFICSFKSRNFFKILKIFFKKIVRHFDSGEFDWLTFFDEPTNGCVATLAHFRCSSRKAVHPFQLVHTWTEWIIFLAGQIRHKSAGESGRSQLQRCQIENIFLKKLLKIHEKIVFKLLGHFVGIWGFFEEFSKIF